MVFKEICAAGSSYEIGLTHGSKAKDMVAGTIEYYRQKFEPIWNCSWAEIKEFSNQYYNLIQAYFPQYIEEMRGLCDGSGQRFDDILAINCHYEIARKGGLAEHSCSVIGVESSRSTDGHTYMAENWDYGVFQKNNTIILKLTLPDDTRICMVTEAGIIGRMGFNSNGIGYCGNTLKNDYVGLKLPLHMMKRLILEQHTLKDIRSIVRTFGTGSSFNILTGSSTEGISDFEVDSHQTTELLPVNGLMFHTNHFLASQLHTRKEYIKYQKNESVLRYASLKQSLEPLEKISLQDIKNALVQHGNHPQGVCTHADHALPIKMQWATICSLVMDLTKQTMYLCEGNPCEHTYLETKLP